MPLVRKRKIKKKYIGRKKCAPQKCAYFDTAANEQCNKNAVGRSTLCEKHGGLRYDPALALSTKESKELIAITATKFRLDYHPLNYIALSREGLSPVEIAAKFQVGLNTVESWAEVHSDFQFAFQLGQALYESWWLMKGKKGLNKRGFNTSLFKFLTGNKLGYSDKIESKNLNINQNMHGVLVVPEKVTEAEWEDSFEK